MSTIAGHTEKQLRRVWELPEQQQRLLLRPALAKLYESNTSETYLTEWTSMLRESAQVAAELEVQYLPRNTPLNGHERFIEVCLQAGLFDAMLKVADLITPAAKRARTHALSTWYYIGVRASKGGGSLDIPPGSENYIKGVLLRSLRSDIFLQRLHAVRCIHMFAMNPREMLLSNKDISDIMYGCLSFAHGDHQTLLDDLKSKQFSWQREIMLAHVQSEALSVEDALLVAPRLWSSRRDDALDASSRFLRSRSTYTIRRDCLEIIEHHPQILAQLLILVSACGRVAWDPEANPDVLAAEILAHLLMPPYLWIPELAGESFAPSQPWGGSRAPENDETLAEWQAAVSCWQMFVEQRNWKAILLKKWSKLQSEFREEIMSKLGQNGKIEPNLVESIFISRGKCRSCLLRILINLTYNDASNNPIVSTQTLFPFLPLAYEASQKVPSEARATCSTDNVVEQRDALCRLEQLSTVFKTSSKGGPKFLASLVLPSSYMLGPVLLFCILRRIYDTFGTDIGHWVALPENTLPNDHLGRVQQITSEETLGIVMRNAILKRIPWQKAEGSNQLEKKLSPVDCHVEDYARTAYLAAAELAIAVERFDAAAGSEKLQWVGLIPTAKKELLACLGNVSLMSSRLGQWQLAWWYARHTLKRLEGIDQADAKRNGWDQAAMKAKNEMRLANAAAKLAADM